MFNVCRCCILQSIQYHNTEITDSIDTMTLIIIQVTCSISSCGISKCQGLYNIQILS